MSTIPTTGIGKNDPMIRITDLHKSFTMGSQELALPKEIDLDMPHGPLVAIVEARSALPQSPSSLHQGPASTFQ
jgi:hypothetical protein